MNTEIDDRTLNDWIQATAQRQQSAFEMLYSATSPTVFALLRRILRVESLAEEALQEVFVKIWEKASTYHADKSSPKTWIVSIARQHAIDELRKRDGKASAPLAIDKTDLAGLPPQNLPHSRDEQVRRLERGIQRMDASARKSLLLAYCDGFSLGELSQIEQQSVPTIKNQVRRTLLALKEGLDEQQ